MHSLSKGQNLLFNSILIQDHEMWLWLRCTGLGGSDAAIVLGESPYRNLHDLRLQKLYNRKSKRSIALDFGIYIERFIFERVCLQEDQPVFPGAPLGTLFSRQRRWQLANLDGHIGPWGSETTQGLEIKHCISKGLGHWSNGPPRHYIAQLQHYMAVTGWDKFVLYCLVVQNDRDLLLQHIQDAHDPDAFTRAVVSTAPLLRFEVDRDEDYIQRLCRLEERAWRWIMGSYM